MSNPEFHQCSTCGYEWKHGMHGGHSCSDTLKAVISAEQQAHAATKQQFAAEREAHAQLQSRCYDQGGTFSNVFDECAALKKELVAEQEAKEAAESRIKASREQEPVWYAVMSIEAPVLNRAIRSLDGAYEYAAGCRENYGGVSVIELYAQPPIPPDSKRRKEGDTGRR